MIYHLTKRASVGIDPVAAAMTMDTPFRRQTWRRLSMKGCSWLAVKIVAFGLKSTLPLQMMHKMRIIHRHQIRLSSVDQLLVSLDQGKEKSRIKEHMEILGKIVFKQGASRSDRNQFYAKR